MQNASKKTILNKEFRQEVRENPKKVLPLLGLRGENVKVITSTKKITFMAIPYQSEEVKFEDIGNAGAGATYGSFFTY